MFWKALLESEFVLRSIFEMTIENDGSFQIKLGLPIYFKLYVLHTRVVVVIYYLLLYIEKNCTKGAKVDQI